MGAWIYQSKAEDDGAIIMQTNLQEVDANGAVSGTVTFRSKVYTVTGQWAAKGSVTGRNASVFWFGGASSDDAPSFLVGAGDLGVHGTTAFMNIAVTTASSGDGEDYGYNGQLTQVIEPDDGGD